MDASNDDSPTLGTLLRRLLAHLDGAVQDAYVLDGLDYRPRYTPIVRALLREGEATILTLAAITGVSHSATSQTVGEMVRCGLVRSQTGTADARAKVVTLTARGRRIVDTLRRHWAATNAAAHSLDRELPMPLTTVVAAALDALDRRPFAQRIAEAAIARPSSQRSRRTRRT